MYLEYILEVELVSAGNEMNMRENLREGNRRTPRFLS